MKPLFTHLRERHDRANSSPQPTAHSPQRFERALRRLGSPFVFLFLVSALVACGGGGDGGTTVPTPNPATGTLTASGCTVPDGASSCNASASWTTSNATSPRLTSGGATVSTLPSGSATFSISLGTTSVALTNAGAVLASTNVTASCGANSTVVSGVCQATAPAVLRYSDIILANSDQYGWYPVKLVVTSGANTGTVAFSAEKAVNATRFQTGAWPLFNCGFNTTKLATGAVKLSCQDAVSLARHDLVWNPVTNQITEYDGSEGVYPVYSDATWIDVQSAVDAPIVGWGAYAEISVGWIWGNTTDRVLRFKRKSDGMDVTLPLSIGLVKAFGAFSN